MTYETKLATKCIAEDSLRVKRLQIRPNPLLSAAANREFWLRIWMTCLGSPVHLRNNHHHVQGCW